jgi:hypothetical protein
MDASKSFGLWSYLDIADPAKGQEGYPRLLIENRAYCSTVFRKLHLELAHRQDGMQVRVKAWSFIWPQYHKALLSISVAL